MQAAKMHKLRFRGGDNQANQHYFFNIAKNSIRTSLYLDMASAKKKPKPNCTSQSRSHTEGSTTKSGSLIIAAHRCLNVHTLHLWIAPPTKAGQYDYNLEIMISDLPL